MKKIIPLLCASILIYSCQSTKDFVTVYGKISNKNSKEIVLKNPKISFERKLKLDQNGIFKDTFKLKKPSYMLLTNGDEKNVLYLKNGDDINVSLNAEAFKSSFSVTGKGVEETKYLQKKSVMQKDFFKDSLYQKPETTFNSRLKKYSAIFNTELHKSKDSAFIAKQSKYIKSFEKYAKKTYKFERYLALNLGKGTPAPDFSYKYKDLEGKEYALTDLKGKNLYVKFWATWCASCRKEAPYYKKLAKKYKDSNVKFVSISIDNKRSFKMWKRMVAKAKNNGITELFSENDEDFREIYKLNEIPRYILIDPEGKIIDANAPAPTTKEISEIIDNLVN